MFSSERMNCSTCRKSVALQIPGWVGVVDVGEVERGGRIVEPKLRRQKVCSTRKMFLRPFTAMGVGR